MRIPVFDLTGDKKISCGHLSIHDQPYLGSKLVKIGPLGPHPSPRNRWTVVNEAPLTQRSGLYEWVIQDASGHVLAHYVGMASKSVASRIGHYWRDMTPTLIHAYSGRPPPLTARLADRDEKSCLRWIHLWLAWAYLEVTSANAPNAVIVELWWTGAAAGSSLADQEKELIAKRRGIGCLVNKEAIGLSNIERVRQDIVSLPPKHCRPVPPEWNGKVPHAWDKAIAEYGRWRTAHGRPFP